MTIENERFLHQICKSINYEEFSTQSPFFLYRKFIGYQRRRVRKTETKTENETDIVNMTGIGIVNTTVIGTMKEIIEIVITGETGIGVGTETIDITETEVEMVIEIAEIATKIGKIEIKVMINQGENGVDREVESERPSHLGLRILTLMLHLQSSGNHGRMLKERKAREWLKRM